MTEVTREEVEGLLRKALNRAFILGQTYWQQADSESPKQWRKSDETRASFDSLVSETVALVRVPTKGE